MYKRQVTFRVTGFGHGVGMSQYGANRLAEEGKSWQEILHWYYTGVTIDNCKAYTGNITITADAATHTQTIAMTYLPADYTKVDEAIAKANALNTDEYKDFTAVEAAVNAVVRDKNITEQSEVDAMAKAIEDAIAALQYKDADYTKVDAAIAKANALKKDDYKDFSGVEAAVNAVAVSYTHLAFAAFFLPVSVL